MLADHEPLSAGAADLIYVVIALILVVFVIIPSILEYRRKR